MKVKSMGARIIGEVRISSIARVPPIEATIDTDPDTLNLKSNGQWITAYITLPEGYSAEDIDPTTVIMDEISAAWSEIQNGVYVAKFDRATVQACLTNECARKDLVCANCLL